MDCYYLTPGPAGVIFRPLPPHPLQSVHVRDEQVEAVLGRGGGGRAVVRLRGPVEVAGGVVGGAEAEEQVRVVGRRRRCQ